MESAIDAFRVYQGSIPRSAPCSKPAPSVAPSPATLPHVYSRSFSAPVADQPGLARPEHQRANARPARCVKAGPDSVAPTACGASAFLRGPALRKEVAMVPRFSPHLAARRPRLCYVLLSTEEGRIYGTRKSTTKSNANASRCWPSRAPAHVDAFDIGKRNLGPRCRVLVNQVWGSLCRAMSRTVTSGWW